MTHCERLDSRVHRRQKHRTRRALRRASSSTGRCACSAHERASGRHAAATHELLQHCSCCCSSCCPPLLVDSLSTVDHTLIKTCSRHTTSTQHCKLHKRNAKRRTSKSATTDTSIASRSIAGSLGMTTMRALLPLLLLLLVAQPVESCCPNACSGHGICTSSGNGCLCSCFKGFTGGDCSSRAFALRAHRLCLCIVTSKQN